MSETEDQASREVFEAWASLGGDPDYRRYLERDADGNYLSNVTKGAWAAWQARGEYERGKS